MAPLDVPRLAPGDRVQHELLVRERDDKVTKSGDPFVVLVACATKPDTLTLSPPRTTRRPRSRGTAQDLP